MSRIWVGATALIPNSCFEHAVRVAAIDAAKEMVKVRRCIVVAFNAPCFGG